MSATPAEAPTTELSLDDLHLIRATLNSAYHQNLVLDLAEQYRKLQQRPQTSKLTQALSNTLAVVTAHLASLVEEEVTEAGSDE